MPPRRQIPVENQPLGISDRRTRLNGSNPDFLLEEARRSRENHPKKHCYVEHIIVEKRKSGICLTPVRIKRILLQKVSNSIRLSDLWILESQSAAFSLLVLRVLEVSS